MSDWTGGTVLQIGLLVMLFMVFFGAVMKPIFTVASSAQYKYIYLRCSMCSRSKS